MELHIEAQHTELDPDLKGWITARLDALNAPEQDMLHARVTVVKHIHHLRGSEEARVMLVLAGKTLSATGTGDTITDALYAVLDIIEGELHDFRTVRRSVVKAPGPHSLPLHGQRAPSFTGARSPRLRWRRGHSFTCPRSPPLCGRRGRSFTHPLPHGRIVRVFPDEGYGFSETEAHQDVYFHTKAVHGFLVRTCTSTWW